MGRHRLCTLVILLCCVLSAFSQDAWQQSFSSLDQLGLKIQELQSSNAQQKSDNEKINELLISSQSDITVLLSLNQQQGSLLKQWEDNWQQTASILTTQQTYLTRYKKLLRISVICIPVALVTGMIIQGVNK